MTSRMNIDEFMSNFKGGGARPNRFYVEMTIPALAGANTPLRFLCKAAQIPGSTIGSVDVGYMGRQFKVPGDRTFAEYTITVLNDVDFKLRYAFESWMAAINTHIGNKHLKAGSRLNMKELMATMEVNQLGRDDTILAKYLIKDAFPTDLAAIDLAWDSNDSVEEFTVTLQYQYWESVATIAVDSGDSSTIIS